MNSETFETLPYNGRNELLELKKFINEFYSKHINLINLLKEDSILIGFEDINKKYSYIIKFEEYNRQKLHNFYSETHNPRSLSRIESISNSNLSLEQIKTNLNNWIDIVDKMNKVTFDFVSAP